MAKDRTTAYFPSRLKSEAKSETYYSQDSLELKGYADDGKQSAHLYASRGGLAR